MTDGGRTEITTEAGFGQPVRQTRLNHYRTRLPVFLNKNKGVLQNAGFWRIAPSLAWGRMAGLDGVPRDGRLRFVGTHHKAMTTYFSAVLRLFAFGARLRFQEINLEAPDPRTEILLSNHSKFDLGAIGAYRGVHVLRDPRDMIVSGYHYHKWTHEAWVHRPDANGRSYQQKLREADQTTGLFMEIDHFIFFYRETLETWDLQDPDILELKYEDLMGDDRESLYAAIFDHFGMTGPARERGIELMRMFEAKRRTARTGEAETATFSHIRSGASRQWERVLEPAHLDYIQKELGNVLQRFGYD